MPVDESNMIDLDSIIGVYSISNTGTVLLHKIDYERDRVLASMNGCEPCWYDITESEMNEEIVQGFWLCAIFVPFHLVMRFYEYAIKRADGSSALDQTA